MEKIGDLQHIWLRPHKFEVVTIWSYINSNTVTVIITMPVARIVEDVFVVLNWKTRKEIENCWDWNLTVWKLRQVRLIDLDTLNIKDDRWCWLGETLSATFQFFSEASRKKDGVNGKKYWKNFTERSCRWDIFWTQNFATTNILRVSICLGQMVRKCCGVNKNLGPLMLCPKGQQACWIL